MIGYFDASFIIIASRAMQIENNEFEFLKIEMLSNFITRQMIKCYCKLKCWDYEESKIVKLFQTLIILLTSNNAHFTISISYLYTSNI